MSKITQQEILAAAMRQTAADCSCPEEAFRREDNVVVESFPAADGSRYLEFPHLCALFSYGSNVVASCRRDLIPDIAAFVNAQEQPFRCFDQPGICALNRILRKAGAQVAWTHLYYLPEIGAVFSAELPCPLEIRVLDPGDFAGLYLPEWRNALSRDRRELDRLAVGAYDRSRLVGLAGCSADCPEMWQIGIDVLPEYRRSGIASALTNQLARLVFERGKIPFYAAAWANIRSIRNGLRCGFRPAWAAMTAKIPE